ncbi:squalene synthetase-like protein [Coemansia nantahalensis]|uniref:Squalene synthetase-like protein n=1 Tax=Coemansia nantahalensis TaxID=2789366 RepID=A0ACC1K3Y3_9FUNG|nr:squalene synthetase-like protein [Coemansia nantahalensis]
MDGLFYVDTRGSAGTPATTASSSREFRGVVQRATPQPPPPAGNRRGIQVLDDNIAPQAGRSATPRSRGPTAMRRLNAQFLELDVQGKPKKKGRARPNRQRQRKGTDTPLDQVQRPPEDMSDGDFGAAADDYMENLSDDARQQLAAAGMFARREIGGGASVSGPFGGLSSSSGDDQYRLGGEGVSSGDSEGDDDDGFPQGMDMQQLPGPDGPRAGRGRRGGHMQRAQNTESYRERDRAKGRHGPRAQGGDESGHGGGLPSGFDPHRVVKRLELLTQSSDLDSIWLQPMDKKARQIVHVLAREYKIKSKSQGNGAMRAPVLTATADSRPPKNRRRINQILQIFDEGRAVPEHWLGGPTADKHSGGARGRGRGRGGQAAGPSAANLHGKMVAEGVPEVGASNIGHKMLQQMGWTPGTGLGAEEKGRAAPVDVTIRTGRRGLGA